LLYAILGEVTSLVGREERYQGEGVEEKWLSWRRKFVAPFIAT
jgi:hypothetical protein